jgi:hypothetical protein
MVIVVLVIYFCCKSPEHSTGKRFEVEGRGKREGQTDAVFSQ